MILIIAGLVPMGVVGFISVNTASKNIEALSLSQLESIRSIKSGAIERYFQQIRNQASTMASNPAIVTAMGDFDNSFNQLAGQTVGIQSMRASVRDYYENQYAALYRDENSGNDPGVAQILSSLDDATVAMQYHYISNNRNPLGSKHLLDTADAFAAPDSYDAAHAQHHPYIREFLETFGYYDIFLVDLDRGNIVYSVYKELDYATSLSDGPYADTNFAQAYRQATTLAEGETTLVDFSRYKPSYEAGASFMASPIFENGRRIGVLVFQMPLETINAIMMDRAGMGESGESYLVGEDLLMRSDSYLDPEFHSVASSFRNPEQGKVDTEAVQSALAGRFNAGIITDYNNNLVLSAYAPIDLGEFNWAVLAEIDVAEAFATIDSLQTTAFILAAVSALLLGVIAFFISKVIAKPILTLADSIQRVQQTGDFSIELDNDYKDEIGATSQAFGKFLHNLSSSFSQVNNVLQEISNGKYNSQVNGDYSGEIAKLQQGINHTVGKLAENDTLEEEKQRALEAVEEAQRLKAEVEEGAKESARINQALDAANANVMLADADNVIIYMNTAVVNLFRDKEQQIRKLLPNFNASSLIGSSMDVFHKNPSHQRNIIGSLSSSMTSVVEIGDLSLKIQATPLTGNGGERLGTVVEWQDITLELLAEAEAQENFRIRQALGKATTNVMLADADNMIIYVNESLQSMFSAHERKIQSEIPEFRVSSLVGTNTNIFHKNASLQKGMVSGLTSTLISQAKVADLTFKLIANPIIDDKGVRLGTLLEWADRTQELGVEDEVQTIVQGALAGDLSQRISLQGKEGFFETLSSGINELVGVCENVINDTIAVLSKLAEGNLTQKINNDYKGSFGRLREDANTTVDKLTEVVANIKQVSSSVATGAEEISQGNTNLSQRTEEQASSLEQTASSMEEMTSTVQQNAHNAREADELALGAREKAQHGGEVVSRAVIAMSEINGASKRIADIISVIDEIAFQTNLLALNASVEAARAGEQGRGFAVVASEVRNLAGRSATAAKEIKDLIQDSVNKVDEGSKLVDESGKTLDEIISAVQKVTSIVAEISAASAEQASGIEEVNKAINQMDEMTQQNAALVEQAAAASEAMGDQAADLNKQILFFTTDEKALQAVQKGSKAGFSSAKPTRLKTYSAPKSISAPRSKALPSAASSNAGDNDWEEF